MSLVNNLQSQPVISADGGRRTYHVKLNDLQAGGAFTTVDIVLDQFPAGSVIEASRIKHLTSVAGTSFSAATARLGFGPAGSETLLGSGALDVFAAPGTTDGTHSISQVTPIAGDTESANRLIMRVTSTGGNLSAATAGEIEAVANVAVVGF